MEKSESNDLSLIDFSSENDSLIATASTPSTVAGGVGVGVGVRDCQSSETHYEASRFDFLSATNAERVVDMDNSNVQKEELPQLLETSEPVKARKTGKFNLRKSLAWDSAFFTSSGVLDPEELSSMMEGAENGINHHLPRIEEDACRSTDSISTLASDNLTLQNLEAELFEDIRASIQKSSKASKKADLASRSKAKQNPSSSKQTNGMQGYGKTSKQGDSGPQVTKASGSKGHQASKMPGLAGPRRAVPKSALSSKSSPSGSSGATKTQLTRSSSSDSSGSGSGNIGKSPSISARRKIDTRTANPRLSCSIPKTPSKSASRIKTSSQTNGSMLTKLSSSISPASSVSEWSLESSSSSSVSNVNQTSKPRSSLDTGFCKSLDSDAQVVLGLPTNSTDHLLHGYENEGTTLPSQYTKRAFLQTGTLSRPPSSKPTGLRMPSPKIGFFDGAKSVVRPPNGGMQSQSRLSTAFPKSGVASCSPIGSSNKSKFGKTAPVTTVTLTGNTKLGSQKSASPKPFREPSGSSRGVKSCPSIPLAQDEMNGVDIKAEDIGRNGHDRAQHITEGLDAERNTNIGVLESKMSSSKQESADLKEINLASANETFSDSKSDNGNELIKPSHGVGDCALYDHQTSELDILTKTHAKENSHFEDKEKPGGVSCKPEVRTGKPDRAKGITDQVLDAEGNESLGVLTNTMTLNLQETADLMEIKVAPGDGDISPLYSATNWKENGHIGDQADDLSRNLRAVDSRLEFPKELICSTSLKSCSDFSASELCSEKPPVDDQEEQSLHNSFASTTRTPFAVKNAPCSGEWSKDSSIGLVEKTAGPLLLSELGQKENS
ncbi:hypothetical protein RJ639_006745 [Escallonia herrerae]|uniref:Uncharacterized protein n=1 Tax=Escallonia herrerae TaxID=1293975 RepID=A0AA89AVC5_9ASTE|nr:hypothetical protein RJ639_006745 [Escallonia herrerae]